MSSLKRVTSSRAFVITVLVLVIAFGSAVVYFSYPFRASSYLHVGPNRAAIIDGLSEFNANPEFMNQTTHYLEASGLSVDVYTAPKVTVEFMKSFPAGYELVIFRVHSSTSRHGVFYFTSEPYDESKYEPEQFRDELRPAKDYEGHPPVFAFGPKFINTYLEGRFAGAIIIGMGCFGAGVSYGTEEEVTIENVSLSTEKGPNLADAFVRQGAVAVIGWDSLVMLSFSDKATLRLVEALAIGQLSVRQATETVNLEVGFDPVYKSRLVYYPEQNGDNALHRSAANSSTIMLDTKEALIELDVKHALLSFPCAR